MAKAYCYGARLTNTRTGGNSTVWFMTQTGRDAMVLDMSVQEMLSGITVKKIRPRFIRDGVDTPHVFFNYRDFVLFGQEALPE